MSSEDVVVSVCVVTYNQERYIKECIESLVCQEVDFKYEILIGDDASTDGTQVIINDYAARYPGLIIPVIRSVNVGGGVNAFELYKMAKGEYIVHMDGDDTAFPQKLRTQVEILQAYPSCVYTTHDAQVIDRDSKVVRASLKRHADGIHSLGDLYQRLPFFTQSTKMFRNLFSNDFYDAFSPDAIDIEVHVAQAQEGDIYHIDKPLGAYRVFTGMSSSNQRVNPLIVKAYRRVFEASLRDGCRSLPAYELRAAYAAAMLNFSYQSAYMGRYDDCAKFSSESMKIARLGMRQLVLHVLSRYPSVLAKLVGLRSLFKKYK